jgi:hypothetical protein
MVNQPWDLSAGTPKSESMMLLCSKSEGQRFISTYLSPLDAVLGSKCLTNEDHYWPINFQCVDTRHAIKENEGWLVVSVCYAYAAHNNRLVVDAQGNPGMIYIDERFHIPPDTQHFTIQFADRVSEQINRVYDKAGLRNFGATVDEMELWTAEQIAQAEQEALDNLPATISVDKMCKSFFDQCALYDPESMEWVFVDVG